MYTALIDEFDKLSHFSVYPALFNAFYLLKWKHSDHIERMLVWMSLIKIHEGECDSSNLGTGATGQKNTMAISKRLQIVVL
jgi:hypothetical protein